VLERPYFDWKSLVMRSSARSATFPVGGGRGAAEVDRAGRQAQPAPLDRGVQPDLPSVHDAISRSSLASVMWRASNGGVVHAGTDASGALRHRMPTRVVEFNVVEDPDQST
jgi:hypothetical protein